MTIFRFTIFLIFFFFSCKDNKVSFSAKDEEKSKPSAYFSKKPDKYYYDYKSELSEISNFSQGYIDTFSVNGIKFQLLSNPDFSGHLELQVLRDGMWRINLKTAYGQNGNDANSDVNGDGFNDFKVSLLRGSHLYLYDSSLKEFHKEPIYLAFEWSVIDSSHNLYANEYANGYFWHTNLFCLNGFKQTFLYNAVIEVQIDSMKEIGDLRLYKLHNGNLTDSTLLEQSQLDFLKKDHFDYQKYWAKIIKKRGYN